MTEKHLQITLTNNEALVLFELLSRFSDSKELTIEHQSEETALWNLNCLLERELVELFKSNYNESLQAARENLLPGKG